MATAHAKNRPPSAAKRWLPCPYSATVAPLYPRDESDQSLKGDREHNWMETLILFGTLPLDVDPDAADNLQDLYDYVVKRFKVGGPSARIYVEVQLDIPETGEFGTADIIIVCDDWIEIIDYKSGYVVVHVYEAEEGLDEYTGGHYNAQMMTYLLGAIAKFGPRSQYFIGVHQPNYDHVEGSLRTKEVTDLDVFAHRSLVKWSMGNPDHISAGPHCKATYCEHRGACETFRVYCMDDLSLGWQTSELKAMSDEDLSKALDASDELAGWRTELRAEAMRRIMNMDRKIHGYKVVKGRRNRSVSDARALVNAVHATLGVEWAVRLFPDLVWVRDLPYDREEVLAHLGTPKHIEDVIKQYARVHNLPRGGWKMIYDNVVGAYIRETAEGLTLERAIDGRPAHKRGSEFGVLANPATGTTVL